MKFVHLILALAALVTGCASAPEQANESTARNQVAIDKMMSAPCCTQIGQVSYVPIVKGKNPVIEINEKSPLVAVADGRSYASGILVPPRTSATYLTIRSFGVGIWAPSSLNFFPSFLFFDDDGTPLSADVKWAIRPARADWGDRSSLEALIELPASVTSTRVLVYTKPENLNKRSPIIVDAGVFMVPNGVFGAFRAYLP